MGGASTFELISDKGELTLALASGYIANNEDALQKYSQFVEMFKKSRYLINQDHEFYQHYLPALKEKTLFITKGQKFFRARNNGLEDFKEDKDLQAPPEGTASIGRINPKGISYLYVAEEWETAVAEVQPWMNAKVTIAECIALEDLIVADLLPSVEELHRVNSYRKVIGLEFSKPVRPDTKELDYIPTQYIAEYFKNSGLDGLRYRSALHSGGVNLAFFNPKNFEVKKNKVVTVKDIKYFSE